VGLSAFAFYVGDLGGGLDSVLAPTTFQSSSGNDFGFLPMWVNIFLYGLVILIQL
jgi:hypothetical protein